MISIGNTPVISNDGRFVAYNLENQFYGDCNLVIQTTDNSWKLEFLRVSKMNSLPCLFSFDSRLAIFKVGDTLYTLVLANKKLDYVASVESCQYPNNGKGEWLAYRTANNKKELVLSDIVKDKKYMFSSVEDCRFDENGTILVIKEVQSQDSIVNEKLNWINLTSMEKKPSGATDHNHP